jgi:hypothetical protein
MRNSRILIDPHQRKTDNSSTCQQLTSAKLFHLMNRSAFLGTNPHLTVTSE